MHLYKLYFRIFQYALWLCFNFLFRVVQWVVWEFSGVADMLRRGSLTPWFESASQVLKVEKRFKFCIFISPASKWDFLLTHERFERPDYVLKDSVTLYGINEDEAFFVETEEDVRVWDLKKNSPFIMNPQFEKAIRVIRMPIETLHYLGDKLGDPKGKLIFVSNCSRCGSTLLQQMFAATEKFVTLGEPNSLNFLSKVTDIKSGSNGMKENFNRLTKSVVRVLCKPHQSFGDGEIPMGYFIKLCSPAMGASGYLHEIFPNSSHLYLYRDPIKVAQSMYRLSEAIYSVKFIYHFGKNSASRLSFAMSLIGFPPSSYRICAKHDMTLGILNWCVLLKMYEEFRKEKKEIAALRFEDLVSDTLSSLTRILTYCELPGDLRYKAAEATNWNSQSGTPLSSEYLKQFPLLRYEGEIKEEGDKMAKYFSFPAPEEKYTTEFTITDPNCSLKEIKKNKK